MMNDLALCDLSSLGLKRSNEILKKSSKILKKEKKENFGCKVNGRRSSGVSSNGARRSSEVSSSNRRRSSGMSSGVSSNEVRGSRLTGRRRYSRIKLSSSSLA